MEKIEGLIRKIENLPDRCKEIFRLIFIDGLTTDQIGERLNISPQTVRTQKARALDLIKSELLKKNLLSALLYLLLLFPADRHLV